MVSILSVLSPANSVCVRESDISGSVSQSPHKLLSFSSSPYLFHVL